MGERIEPQVGVVIVAGGSGSRMGGKLPKQYSILGQKPLLAHTIIAFVQALPKCEIVVVVAEDRVDYWRNLAARFDLPKHRVVAGGAQRFDSVKCGVEALSDDVDIIAVHDGARPFCSQELILRCVECAVSNGSAVPVVAISDSLREVVDGGSHSVDRANMRAVQTPQMFDAAGIRRAYAGCSDSHLTDDAQLFESVGQRVYLCDGERGNIKITTPEDMLYAQYIVEQDS